MTDRGAGEPDDVPGDEAFLARWSRRKAEARTERAAPASAPAAPDAPPVEASAAQQARSQQTAAEAAPARDRTSPDTTARDQKAASTAPQVEPHANEPAVALPDLDQLDQDSDYSAFLAPGVDANLRRRALRKLFHSPKFNVFDGLDTYRDDFTSFPALGNVVTADMRHQLERLSKQLVAETVLPDRDLPPSASLPSSTTLPPPATLPPTQDPPPDAAATALQPTETEVPIRPAPSAQDDDEPRDPA
jgi:hypothetical protein